MFFLLSHVSPRTAAQNHVQSFWGDVEQLQLPRLLGAPLVEATGGFKHSFLTYTKWDVNGMLMGYTKRICCISRFFVILLSIFFGVQCDFLQGKACMLDIEDCASKLYFQLEKLLQAGDSTTHIIWFHRSYSLKHETQLKLKTETLKLTTVLSWQISRFEDSPKLYASVRLVWWRSWEIGTAQFWPETHLKKIADVLLPS